MIRQIIICTESREKGVCNDSGRSAVTVAGFFAILFFLFSIFNTVFLIQELASVPTKMKRFLTSKTADARADSADLTKERATHPWRTLYIASAHRHSFSVGVSRPRLSLAHFLRLLHPRMYTPEPPEPPAPLQLPQGSAVT
jgi:hypothetical protein